MPVAPASPHPYQSRSRRVWHTYVQAKDEDAGLLVPK